ncbi:MULTISPECIES: hypothetical protein [unclassified Pseudomonas]|uniref:hypothetical protein n=1 Tax=unclassified Pseudomonas TaxID=196821 RepID=UPI000D9F9BD7|nr:MULTISPECIES: hypothetical protein [unclassified Pseudomonas]PYG79879.1 hypothetical protein N428_02204 [Pseudomonas sp. RV120224-01c]PYG83617.1 hypothetical protein N436_01968 [Pseudomonas sp. RV120224-01b]
MKEELVVPAVAALVVGLIAGIVSLVVSILAKDQKTSEFRQAWIDGLRNDVSQLVAHFGVMKTVAGIVRERTQAEIDDYLINKQEQFLEIEMLVSRIRLRLNPEEHVEMLRLLEDLETIRDSEISPRAENISVQAQDILKTEWERVKRGEPSFVWLKRVSKWGVLSTLSAGAGVCAAIVYEHFGLPGITG